MSRQHRRASDHAPTDFRGLLAVSCVVGAFALAFIGVLSGKALALAEIPAWTAGIVGTVIGYYFGSKGATGTAEQTAQGLKLEQVHSLVNSRFDELQARNDVQAQELKQAAVDAAVIFTKGDPKR